MALGGALSLSDRRLSVGAPRRRGAAPRRRRRDDSRSRCSSCFLSLSPAAFAVQPDEQLADPALEARARDISGGLRCLVCQNQSIDDSDAPLARDLRLLVRERLKAGDSDDAVRDYLVARYGDFILLKPPFEMGTLLLWLTPLAVLIVGRARRVRAIRRRHRGKPLSRDEEDALQRILREQLNGAVDVLGQTLPIINATDTAP